LSAALALVKMIVTHRSALAFVLGRR
jgi:hypothetical protein